LNRYESPPDPGCGSVAYFRPVSPLLTLLRKDVVAEWRHKHMLFGVLLYVGSMVFIIYAMAGRPEAGTWNVLFWVAQLFAAVNAAARSFLSESAARFRYYATLVPARTYFLSKLLYGLMLQLLVTLASLLLFALLLGLPLYRPFEFLLTAFLGSLSLSLVFTFLSAIASRAGGNAALMAILGFPLLLPVLMMLGRMALAGITAVETPGWWSLVGALTGLDALLLALGLVLFPVLWTD
jgi:heme exporter protein B